MNQRPTWAGVDVGRYGTVLDALEFDDMPEEAQDLAWMLVDQAKNEVGEDELIRYEYFSSAEERDRAHRLGPPGAFKYARPQDQRKSVAQRFNSPRKAHYGVLNVYVNVGRLRSMWLDAAIAIGATIVTGGSAAPGVLAVIARAVASLKILTEDEAELVHVIIASSKGHAYSRPFPESQLRAAYRGATVSLDALIEKLIDRGFAVRRGDGIQLVF